MCFGLARRRSIAIHNALRDFFAHALHTRLRVAQHKHFKPGRHFHGIGKSQRRHDHFGFEQSNVKLGVYFDYFCQHPPVGGYRPYEYVVAPHYDVMSR